MKAINFFLTMLSCTAISMAQQPVAATAPAAATPMAQAIAQTDFVSGNKPSTEAKYYMFIASASWCGPCRAVMPGLVKEYPNMMANKDVEVILLSCDNSPQKAIEYLAHYNAPFAVVMYGSPAAQALPGYPKDIHGIPHIVVVDADGKLLYRGHGRRYADWKMHVEANKQTQK